MILRQSPRHYKYKLLDFVFCSHLLRGFVSLTVATPGSLSFKFLNFESIDIQDTL